MALVTTGSFGAQQSSPDHIRYILPSGAPFTSGLQWTGPTVRHPGTYTYKTFVAMTDGAIYKLQPYFNA